MVHFRVISHMLSSVAIHTIVVVLSVTCYSSTIHYNIMLVITRVQFILLKAIILYKLYIISNEV